MLCKKTKEDNIGGCRSDEAHSGVLGAQEQSVGAHTNEPHVNSAAQHAAPLVNSFKVDLPKPFDGKTLDSTALEL